MELLNLKKITGKAAITAGKECTLFILDEDISDIIKIIKSWEDSGVSADSVIEIVKHEIKKQEGRFLRVSTFSHFKYATSNFFSSKRYTWKRS